MAEVEERNFRCLRCGAEFKLPYTKGVMQERTCPKCGSNSVRLDRKKEQAASTGTEK
ncbi:MAG: hypothetical protein JSW49_04535 [candidate division WOR-3 bacterium]|nr:MAG: hypothetical protein JSW49_04535 [candidate division WOR-3 bacterium]